MVADLPRRRQRIRRRHRAHALVVAGGPVRQPDVRRAPAVRHGGRAQQELVVSVRLEDPGSALAVAVAPSFTSTRTPIAGWTSASSSCDCRIRRARAQPRRRSRSTDSPETTTTEITNEPQEFLDSTSAPELEGFKTSSFKSTATTRACAPTLHSIDLGYQVRAGQAGQRV